MVKTLVREPCYLQHEPEGGEDMEKPKMLNTDQVSEILGISTRTVKQYAARGRIQAQKIAGSWAFTEDSLYNFLKGEKSHPNVADALAAFVPGLATELRELRAGLDSRRHEDAGAIAALDDILRDYIVPMEIIARK